MFIRAASSPVPALEVLIVASYLASIAIATTSISRMPEESPAISATAENTKLLDTHKIDYFWMSNLL